MAITKCPKCGSSSFVFRATIHTRFDTINKPTSLFNFFRRRFEAICGKYNCKQEFWYYPKSNRITRRNVTLEEKGILRILKK